MHCRSSSGLLTNIPRVESDSGFCIVEENAAAVLGRCQYNDLPLRIVVCQEVPSRLFRSAWTNPSTAWEKVRPLGIRSHHQHQLGSICPPPRNPLRDAAGTLCGWSTSLFVDQAYVLFSEPASNLHLGDSEAGSYLRLRSIIHLLDLLRRRCHVRRPDIIPLRIPGSAGHTPQPCVYHTRQTLPNKTLPFRPSLGRYGAGE